MAAERLLNSVGEGQRARATSEPFVRARLDLIGSLRTSTGALHLDRLPRVGRQGRDLAVVIHPAKLQLPGGRLRRFRRTRGVRLSLGGGFEDLTQERLAPFILRIPCSEPQHTKAKVRDLALRSKERTLFCPPEPCPQGAKRLDGPSARAQEGCDEADLEMDDDRRAHERLR